MPLLEWSDTYSVNDELIDAQHKGLFRLINELTQGMLDKNGVETQKKVVSGMIDYARTHFKAEEEYMLMYGYPNFAAHQAEHTSFIKKATGLKERIETTGMVLPLETFNFLQQWIVNHILVMDKKYSLYISAKTGG